MRVGIVLERREIDHPWQRFGWRAVAVIAGAPAIESPRLLREGPGWRQVHAATLPVALHRRETEGYKRNLSNPVPVVFVVLRSDDADTDDDMPRPAIATVCPYEAQDYLDGADAAETVESVAMPEVMRAWVGAYVEAHHVEVPFVKRKRKPWKGGDEARGAPPRAGGARRG
jgi:hypothetical protein